MKWMRWPLLAAFLSSLSMIMQGGPAPYVIGRALYSFALGGLVLAAFGVAIPRRPHALAVLSTTAWLMVANFHRALQGAILSALVILFLAAAIGGVITAYVIEAGIRRDVRRRWQLEEPSL